MHSTINPGLPAPPISDRREAHQPSDRQSGTLTCINGTSATIATRVPALLSPTAPYWAVGSLITVYGPRSRVICFVKRMGLSGTSWLDQSDNAIFAEAELLGEIVDLPNGRPEFRRGISFYPPIGAVAHRIRREDLLAIYDLGGRKGSEIGTLSQDSDIAASVDIEGMLKKHFAVVGTTGVGKSCSVSILLRAAIEIRRSLRVVIVDPHNEYTNAFRDVARTVDSASFELPFWLFRFEEIVEVIYRGSTAPEDEVEFLRDAIVQAKEMYNARAQAQPSSILKKTFRTEGGTLTADSAQPYRMTDIIALIEDAAGRLEVKFQRSSLRSLRARIESLSNDPSYRFMFGKAAIDGMTEPVIRTLFRLSEQSKPITILQLAGIPADVVNASVSVLARMAFDLSIQSNGNYEILMVCEEAHRYVPADPALGFAPTRRALARIAKEGRKYGCYLAVVTQRPSELDPTILSQCSTVFAMRLANSQDQEIMRSAMPDAATGVLEFLSALSNREAIGFGEGFSTPMRFLFRLTNADALPRMMESDAVHIGTQEAQAGAAYMPAHATESAPPPPVAAPLPPPVAPSLAAPMRPPGTIPDVFRPVAQPGSPAPIQRPPGPMPGAHPGAALSGPASFGAAQPQPPKPATTAWPTFTSGPGSNF